MFFYVMHIRKLVFYFEEKLHIKHAKVITVAPVFAEWVIADDRDTVSGVAAADVASPVPPAGPTNQTLVIAESGRRQAGRSC